MGRFCIPIVLYIAGSLHALTYTWQSKNSEPAFKIDIAENFRVLEAVKENGVLIRFKTKRALIEVRSANTGADKIEFATLVNQKAAQLSSEYTLVKLLSERPSMHRENFYLANWELRRKGITYIDQTGFMIVEGGVLVVSCLARLEDTPSYQYKFSNAIYSLRLLNEVVHEPKIAQPKPEKSSLISAMKGLIFTHMPSSLPAFAPAEIMPKVTPLPKKPEKEIQYDDNYILPDIENRR